MDTVLESAPRLHRFSRAQYDLMGEAGVFDPDERLELLDGEQIDLAPQKSRHATAVRWLEVALRDVLGSGFDIRSPLPVNLDDLSGPGIAVVEGTLRDCRDAHPGTAVLIVEVADSLAYDRGRKLAAYARAGIPGYWVADLVGETLEVCRQPSREEYGERRLLVAADRVAPLAAPGGEILAAGILS